MNGVRVDPVTSQELLAHVEGFLRCGQSHVVQFLAADPSVLAMDDPSYRDVLNSADLNVSDGLPVALILRAQGGATDRIPGTDALNAIVGWGVPRDLKHYFYGGTEALGPLLIARLERTHRDVSIVGVEAPPFRHLEEQDYLESAERSRAAGAEALWIGLGTPKQHIAAQHLARLDAAPVILCVGAAFDFVAGTKRRAPVWMQRAGLEWLFRLGSEPRRLWRRYLVGNPRFLGGVLRERLGIRRSRGS